MTTKDDAQALQTKAGRALLARENEYGEFVPNIEADDIAAIEREAAAQDRERIREPFIEALHGGAGGYMTREQAEAVADAILAEPSDD